MFTYGMYDYVDEWALHVGIPAQRGFGGGTLSVVKRQLASTPASPKLKKRGNRWLANKICIYFPINSTAARSTS